MTTIPTFSAHNGFSLPAIGLGTYDLRGRDGSASVAEAVRAGYRLIDTAFNYENEGAVGHGISQADAPREELIVTSKLPGRHHARQRALLCIEESVYRLGIDALDLHLIHWPNPSRAQYVDAWGAFVEAQERGLIRQIGVSNFLPEHLDRIERETGVRPVVNQIEVHPYFPQEDAVADNAARGIVTEAWSPLGRAQEVVEEPVIVEIAAAHDATPVQIVLAWHRARGVVSIPKAASAAHQRANLASVSIALDDAEVAAITALGRPDGRLFDADPTTYEEL